MTSKAPKLHYTEAEAAAELGVSVERLRSLIRSYIATSEEELANAPLATYQRSDLLLLKFLADQQPTATVPD
jgi:hypothetical protein